MRFYNVPLIFFLILFLSCRKKDTLPIIDMHLHAIPVDFEMIPFEKMCSPFKHFSSRDSKISGEEYLNNILNLNTSSTCKITLNPSKSDEENLSHTLKIMEKLNIYGVVSGTPDLMEKWTVANKERIWPGLFFSIGPDSPSPEIIKNLYKSGKLKMFGEVIIQYQGLAPSDSVFEPYLEMAEEIDIPMGIHIGPGPPGAPYLNATQNYRARLHDPLILEEVLVKHPNLRLFVMHAGWPMLDNMLALLWAHPQVYVDLGVICYMLPKKEFYSYLRRLVEAGFIKRIMFGSDQMIWPETIEIGIEAIKNAEFLTELDKRDILYNNAARFLRLSDDVIAQHHGRAE